MSTRYLSNAVIALLGGAVVVLSMGLSSTTAIGWVAFGIAIAVVGISLLAQLDVHRGMTQRLLDGAAVAAGGTLIAVSVVFGGTTVIWLAFALALGLVGVAFAGLTLHEVESWRAAHELGQLHWLAPEAVPRREVPAAGPRAA
jgi:hypothetical protein